MKVKGWVHGIGNLSLRSEAICDLGGDHEVTKDVFFPSELKVSTSVKLNEVVLAKLEDVIEYDSLCADTIEE